jgi:hypothetical protein
MLTYWMGPGVLQETKREAFLVPIKVTGLEVNVDRNKYMVISREMKAG